MKPLIYLFFALALWQIVACYEPVIPTYYISDEDKAYITQPVGSWWVYQDSVSGAIDSIYLLEQTFDIKPVKVNGDGRIGYYYEEVSEKYFSSLKQDCVGGILGRSLEPEFYYLRIFPYPQYPIDLLQKGFASFDKIDSIYILTKPFFDAKKHNSYYFDNYSGQFLWAKEIGLIQANIKTDSINYNWQLLRWHIKDTTQNN